MPKTKSIIGVEILRVGKWNGRDYTDEDLNNLVSSYDDLQGVYDPPAKLGHNKDQSILVSDGLPAAGWVTRLYRQGARLFADFKEVPEKVADLISSGAYRKRSAEIWLNTEFNGKKYPAILKAVSWLGADAPAVAGMSDVFAMYTDAEEREVTVLAYEVELDGEEEHPLIVALNQALSDLSDSAKGQKGVTSARTLIKETLTKLRGMKLQAVELAANVCPDCGETAPDGAKYCPDCGAKMAKTERNAEWDAAYINNLPDAAFAVVSSGGSKDGDGKTTPRALRHFPHHNADGGVDLPHLRNALSRLSQANLSPADRAKAKSHLSAHASKEGVGAENNRRRESMEDSELITLLGLDENADPKAIRAEIVRLKATPAVELSEHNKVVAELEELKSVQAKTEAVAEADRLIAEGKLLPRQKDWAVNLCMNDRETFDTYAKDAPKVVDLKEHGKEGDEDGGKEDVSDAAKEIASRLGVSEEQLTDTRPLSEKLAEQRKAAAAK